MNALGNAWYSDLTEKVGGADKNRQHLIESVITVVAAVIRDKGRILISRRPAGAHLSGLWEFPGGKVEEGESLQVALKREVREELGIEIDVFEECFSTVHEYPQRSVRLHFFVCAITAGTPRAIGVAEFCWVEPSRLRAYSFPEADQELITLLENR